MYNLPFPPLATILGRFRPGRPFSPVCTRFRELQHTKMAEDGANIVRFQPLPCITRHASVLLHSTWPLAISMSW